MAHGKGVPRKRARLNVERLEGRTLLSSMTVSVTTDKPVYQAGQPVQMKFTETNTGNSPVTIQDGPSIDGFDVTEGGKLVWQSNAGNNSLVVNNVTVQPGHSFTLTKTWVAEAGGGTGGGGQATIPASGTFVVTNQLDPAGASASFQIAVPLVDRLTVDSSTYQVGQPIQITLTETNTSLEPVSVPVGPANVTVSQGGSPVWQSFLTLPPTAVQTVQPGQTITQTATWTGLSNVGSLTGTTPWGAFVVSSPEAPAAVSANFQITDPLSTSLTAGIAAGPVVLTFTETNAGAAPLVMPNLPATFTITNVSTGAIVFSKSDSGTLAPVRLAPGQSVTKTATWIQTAAVPLAGGSYSATYQDALEQKTVVFSIGSAPAGPPVGVTDPSEPQPIGPSSPAGPAGPSEPSQPVGGGGGTSPSSPVAPTNPSPPVVGAPSPPVEPAPTPPLPISATLAVAQPGHRRGHRVTITLTLTNTSDKAVALASSPGTDGFSVSSGSGVVWHTAALKTSAKAIKNLAAGQSITLTSIWNGTPNQHHVKRLPAGQYTVKASVGGYSASGSVVL